MIESGEDVDRELQDAVDTHDGRVPSFGTLAGSKSLSQEVWAVAVLKSQTGRPVHGPTPSILSIRIRVTYPGGGFSIGGNFTPGPM